MEPYQIKSISQYHEVLGVAKHEHPLVLPTLQFVADNLNISSTCLSALLKATSQSTKQHVHEKLIEKAKDKLSLTKRSVSEIASVLGFQHPLSCSKLFKNKTNLSPLEFRATFDQ